MPATGYEKSDRVAVGHSYNLTKQGLGVSERRHEEEGKKIAADEKRKEDVIGNGGILRKIDTPGGASVFGRPSILTDSLGLKRLVFTSRQARWGEAPSRFIPVRLAERRESCRVEFASVA